MSGNIQMEMFSDVLEAVGHVDQTQAQEFQRELPPEGPTVGRLVGYIEYGPQEFFFNHKSQGNKLAVNLTFELLHPKKNIKEGKGQLLSMGIKKLSLSTKSNFYKLFMSMRNGREEIKHMAQMLNEPFLITIEHSKAEEGKTQYANIKSVAAPVTLNSDGDEVVLKVPASTAPLRLFVWESPTMETWNSLYIDGTFTVDGVEKSKNRIQEAILKGPGFSGSKLEALLANLTDTPDLEAMFGPAPDELPEELKEEQAAATKKAAPKKGGKKAKEAVEDAMTTLDALGL